MDNETRIRRWQVRERKEQGMIDKDAEIAFWKARGDAFAWEIVRLRAIETAARAYMRWEYDHWPENEYVERFAHFGDDLAGKLHNALCAAPAAGGTGNGCRKELK
jgi:hypothetical protein